MRGSESKLYGPLKAKQGEVFRGPERLGSQDQLLGRAGAVSE